MLAAKSGNVDIVKLLHKDLNTHDIEKLIKEKSEVSIDNTLISCGISYTTCMLLTKYSWFLI